jgi:hypothetical protein
MTFALGTLVSQKLNIPQAKVNAITQMSNYAAAHPDAMI